MVEQIREVGADLVRSHWPDYFVGLMWILATLATTVSGADIESTVLWANSIALSAPDLNVPAWVLAAAATLMVIAVPLAVGIAAHGLTQHIARAAWPILGRVKGENQESTIDQLLDRFACVTTDDVTLIQLASKQVAPKLGATTGSQADLASISQDYLTTIVYVHYFEGPHALRIGKLKRRVEADHAASLPAMILLGAVVARAGFGRADVNVIKFAAALAAAYFPFWLLRGVRIGFELLHQLRVLILLDASRTVQAK